MGKQKRSENTYQKINTLWYRDENNIIMPYDDFVQPEFEYLRNCLWEVSEKIDGTNMRIEVTQIPVYEEFLEGAYKGVKFTVEIKGKTDNANIPKHLYEKINNTYKDRVLSALCLADFVPISEWAEHKWYVSSEDPTPDYSKIPVRYTIYGEGYGVKIQKSGGNYIKNGTDMIMFDVKVTTQTGKDIWLTSESVKDIADKMEMKTVPFLGFMTIDEAIEFVRKGFKSVISENKDFLAEGVVIKTPYGMLDRMGRRLIAKIKTQDFVKYRNMYGTDEKVEQKRNEYI